MSEYRERIEAARADGFTFLKFLTAVDDLGASDGIRVVAMLENPSDGTTFEADFLADRADAVAPRIDDLFPGAAWLQRQVHDLFGVRFVDADDRPLIHHGEGWPLRKEFLLEPRLERHWPGALEPGQAQAAPGRRKLLPVGVPDAALVEDPEATEKDIALSATGTRIRGRR